MYGSNTWPDAAVGEQGGRDATGRRTAEDLVEPGQRRTSPATRVSPPAGLFIHAHAPYQRIARVTALLGPRWRRGDHALRVRLALKVHHVLSAR